MGSIVSKPLLKSLVDFFFFINEDLLAIQFFQGCLQYETKLNSIHSFKRKEKRRCWIFLSLGGPDDVVVGSRRSFHHLIMSCRRRVTLLMYVLGLNGGGDGDSVVFLLVRHRADMANLPAITPVAVVCCCYIVTFS